MKTPLTYYGGKQNIAEWVVSKFPLGYTQLNYVEAFCGGSAVLFEKTKGQSETISDLDWGIYNFFKELRDNGDELFRLIDLTMYNENELTKAKEFIKDESLSDTKKAYYTYLLYQLTYASMYSGSFGYAKNIKYDKDTENKINKRIGRRCSGSFKNKLEKIRLAIDRLKWVQIMNRPAMELIEKFDSNLTLFYLDPPYPETYQQYKNGFSIEDFNKMTKKLTKIKGRFLLSFYQKEGMELYDFKIHSKKTRCTGVGIKETERLETLACNY